MKQIFFVCAVLIISSPALVNNAYAQNAQNAQMATEIETPVNVINSKAVRDFNKEFKQVSDEAWFATDDGFVVKFKQDGVKTRADYNKKGHWLHTIRTYDENKLPPDMRHLVKSSYYDYDILQVQEIEKPYNTFTYIVHREGKTKLINLRISDGDMEEWQKFDKSK
jgi:hypothetical protein